MSPESVSAQPTQPASQSNPILESIMSRASMLPPIKTEEAPAHTMEVKKPEVKSNTSEVGDEDSEVEEVEAPVAEQTPATTKIENQTEIAAKESIAGELDIDDLDDDTRDFVNEIYGKKEPVIKKDATPEDVQEKYKPFVEKANEYEAIMSDPLLRGFIEFRKNGGVDPAEYGKQVGLVDVKKMTPEQLLEMDMKANDFSEEEIAEEKERFESLSPYEKRKQTKQIQEELDRKQNEKLITFNEQNGKTQKIVAEAAKQGTQELSARLEKMIGKNYKGLTIAPEMADVIKHEVIQNPVNKFDDKGQFIGFDVEESIRRAVILNFDAQRSKSLIELGKTMGADKALTARVRPNKKEVSAAVIPVTHKTLEDTRKEFSNERWKNRGVTKK